MIRPVKAAVGLVVGTICGGVTGALMLAVPDYLDEGCGPLGCVKDWAIVGLYLGFFLGGILGAIIGITVGFSFSKKVTGVGVGLAVGLSITIIFFLMGAAGDDVVTACAILAIPAGALIGVDHCHLCWID